MIFVTVGTHEQPFDRLIECVDKLAANGVLSEEVIIQSGYSKYESKNCKCLKLISYQDMKRYIAEARIVVTHGGPASFIMPLQIGKIPVVVPRQKIFGEHVNDHQLEFCKAVAERQKNIIVVEEIKKLSDILLNYESYCNNLNASALNNNAIFNEKLKNIVNELLG